MEALLRKGLAQLGLDDSGAPSLLRYGELLLEKNKVMNLTAITEPQDVATLHFLDSAALPTSRGNPWWMWEPARDCPVCP